MNIDDFRRQLRERAPSFGSWLQLPSPDVAEIVSEGFDWLVVDLEHGSIDRGSLVHLVRAIGGQGKLPLARLMTGDSLLGRQALDAGCVGLVIPHVENASEFMRFADGVTFPPHGSRSHGFFRANGFGRDFEDQKDSPILIPMIESKAGLENLTSILGSGYADAALIGPYDLSASLGVLGDFTSSTFQQAEVDFLAACHEYKIAAGVHNVRPTRQTITDQVNRGYSLIACGMDTVFLTQGVASCSTLRNFKEKGDA